MTKETTEGEQPKTCKDCTPVEFVPRTGPYKSEIAVILCPRHASVDVLERFAASVAKMCHADTCDRSPDCDCLYASMARNVLASIEKANQG